jgi:hypothetical protein
MERIKELYHCDIVYHAAYGDRLGWPTLILGQLRQYPTSFCKQRPSRSDWAHHEPLCSALFPKHPIWSVG